MPERAWFRKKDFYLIACLLFFASALALGSLAIRGESRTGGEYVIYVDNRVAASGLLAGAERGGLFFSLPERPGITFRLENGAVSFSESDCFDKTCVKTGALSKSGQTAACIPNRVIIKIRGNTGKAPDAYVSRFR